MVRAAPGPIAVLERLRVDAAATSERDRGTPGSSGLQDPARGHAGADEPPQHPATLQADRAQQGWSFRLHVRGSAVLQVPLRWRPEAVSGIRAAQVPAAAGRDRADGLGRGPHELGALGPGVVVRPATVTIEPLWKSARRSRPS